MSASGNARSSLSSIRIDHAVDGATYVTVVDVEVVDVAVVDVEVVEVDVHVAVVDVDVDVVDVEVVEVEVVDVDVDVVDVVVTLPQIWNISSTSVYDVQLTPALMLLSLFPTA